MIRLITIVVLFVVVVVVNSGGADVVGNSTRDEERSAKVVLIGAIKKSSVAPAKVEEPLPSSFSKVQANNASNVGQVIVSGKKNENPKLVLSTLAPNTDDQKPGVVDTVVSKAQSMFTSLASLLHINKNANLPSKGNATVPQNASSPAVSATNKSKPLIILPAHSLIPLTQKNVSSPISNATILYSDPKKVSSKIAPSSVVISANDTQEKPVPSAPSLVVSNETLSAAIAPIAKTQLIASNASDIVPVKKVIIGSKGEILTHLAPKVSPTKKAEIQKQSTANSNVLPDAVSAETNSTNSNDPQAKQ